MKRLPLPEKCECCGGDSEIVLGSRCHPGKGTLAILTGDILTITCMVCDKVITRLHVTALLVDE